MSADLLYGTLCPIVVNRQTELVTIFKRKLKSELFYLAYGEQLTVYIVSSHRHTKRLRFALDVRRYINL